MATSYTERTAYRDEFIKAPVGNISYDAGVLISGQNLKAGTVLGKITASGKFTILAPAAADGSQTAAAILRGDVDASAGDVACAVVARLCEVDANLLTWPGGITGPQKTTATTQLASANIIIRA